MRAARLLQILLILQNRGRTTATVLAAELEVTPRTILRDVDALTEAGLPVLVHRGSHGGIELGFNYRTRLTGLARDEAEALAVWLAAPPPELAQLGMAAAAARARAKLVESLPDQARAAFAEGERWFRRHSPPAPDPDPRVATLAAAIRDGASVGLRARSAAPMVLHPTGLRHDTDGWHLLAGDAPPVPLADWGDINIARA